MLEEDLRHRGPAHGAQRSWCSPATPSPAAASTTGLGPLCSQFRPTRKRPQPQSPHGGGTPPSLGAFLSSCWAQGPSLSQSSEVWGPNEVGRGLGALRLDLPRRKAAVAGWTEPAQAAGASGHLAGNPVSPFPAQNSLHASGTTGAPFHQPHPFQK